MRIKDLKIGTKLAIGFGAILLFTAVITVVSNRGISTVNKNAEWSS